MGSLKKMRLPEKMVFQAEGIVSGKAIEWGHSWLLGELQSILATGAKSEKGDDGEEMGGWGRGQRI